MRLRHVLPFAAALVLVGCNDQPVAKSSVTARAPIPAAACPPAPACVPASAKAAPAKASGAGKAVLHKASHRKAQGVVKRRVAARPSRAAYEEGLAGGPASSQYRRYGGPDIPTRTPYAYRRYGEDSYRYGDLPPPERYADDAPPSGYYYRHGGAGRRPAPHEHAYPREDHDARSAERYSSRESGGWRREGGRRDREAEYGYDAEGDHERESDGFVEQRAYRDGRWTRSERQDRETITTRYEERTVSGERGPCCAAGPGEAAGFDRNGFLTWPGKVPARP